MGAADFFFRVFTSICIIAGLGLSVFGVFALLDVITNKSLLNFILALYLIPAGLLIALAELQFQKMMWALKFFPFLSRPFGRGAFAIFFGGLSFGLLRPIGYVVGSVIIFLGIINMCVMSAKSNTGPAPAPAQIPSQSMSSRI
mmetsp:Transcript_21782/g.36025  ORF Transcript_21782/g.36025 Transcript_21782/m.36025 type:complete len:143 (-) Transcript_21782:129-557(-)